MAPVQIDSKTAPQLCRWLRFKEVSGLAPSNWTLATCVRVPEHQREVMPAYDCVGCRYWGLRENS
jgi:hypothetical protein